MAWGIWFTAPFLHCHELALACTHGHRTVASYGRAVRPTPATLHETRPSHLRRRAKEGGWGATWAYLKKFFGFKIPRISSTKISWKMKIVKHFFETQPHSDLGLTFPLTFQCYISLEAFFRIVGLWEGITKNIWKIHWRRFCVHTRIRCIRQTTPTGMTNPGHRSKATERSKPLWHSRILVDGDRGSWFNLTQPFRTMKQKFRLYFPY